MKNKKKKEVDWDYVVSAVISWVGIVAILIAISIALYGCSATFIKGHHNNSSSKEAVEADGDELELMGRHKKNDTPKLIKNEEVKAVDSIITVQPTDSVAGEQSILLSINFVTLKQLKIY